MYVYGINVPLNRNKLLINRLNLRKLGTKSRGKGGHIKTLESIVLLVIELIIIVFLGRDDYGVM